MLVYQRVYDLKLFVRIVVLNKSQPASKSMLINSTEILKVTKHCAVPNRDYTLWFKDVVAIQCCDIFEPWTLQLDIAWQFSAMNIGNGFLFSQLWLVQNPLLLDVPLNMVDLSIVFCTFTRGKSTVPIWSTTSIWIVPKLHGDWMNGITWHDMTVFSQWINGD